MKKILFFFAISFFIFNDLESKQIKIEITGTRDKTSLLNKTAQCSLNFDITNNSYGTIQWIDVEMNFYDNRGEKVKVSGFDSSIGNNTILGDGAPIPVGKTKSFKGDMTLQSACKYIQEYEPIKVKPKYCNIRMLPEKVNCLDLVDITWP